MLISRTKRRVMERLLKCVNRFCQGMDMKLAVEKTVMLTSGSLGTSWKVADDNPCVEAVLVGKYLGIDIQIKGRNLIKAEKRRWWQLLKNMQMQLLDYSGMALTEQ